VVPKEWRNPQLHPTSFLESSQISHRVVIIHILFQKLKFLNSSFAPLSFFLVIYNFFFHDLIIMKAKQSFGGVFMNKTDSLLTVSGASRILNLTPEGVRALERNGKLPATRTTGGIRLFDPHDVEQLRVNRERKKAEGAAA